MSARMWIPPAARFICEDAADDLVLEMKAVSALEDTWRACMRIYQDGDEYAVLWKGFIIGVYRVVGSDD